jgi:hypothetical protein
MTRQLVFVHGRSQEHKDSVALKKEWLDALDEGLKKSGLTLPIAESDVRFPYYGDTLYDLVEGKPETEAAEIVVRGARQNDDERRFIAAVLEEVRQKTGVTDEELAEAAGTQVAERGPLNWEWVQGILKAIDRKLPGGSAKSIAMATKDVYTYLKNAGIRAKIDNGVKNAVTPGVETVMVGHSLGTVVSYNILRQQGKQLGWNVVSYTTVGSPLAVTEIRNTLKSLAPIRCPECVPTWFNAFDERDVVALYPLDARNFPLNPERPAIENKRDVKNKTKNRHGISGYLDDQVVAKRIYDALVA